MRTLVKDIAFPEGPAFDSNGSIWLVEKEAGNLICYKDNQWYRYFVDGAPNGIAIDTNNLLWFCDSKQHSIRTFDPATGTTDTVTDQVDGHTLKMPNDLAFDRNGQLLFTCPGDRLTDGGGYVCCLTGGRQVVKIRTGMYYPNGLAFNREGTCLYIAETGTRLIWKFDWDAGTATLSHPGILANTGGAVGPDGMALDEAGNIYIAVYGAGVIQKISPDGCEIEAIRLPGANPTNCALDPRGSQGLIITEAEKGWLLQTDMSVKGLL
ncbi:SMP-30/gluconolactonase/LRE family protein [Niabella sp. CC-SYL272]|uniref:SMP-30/gluconolactonase/LRE family protein n=1 Tax=Niabella agricola TaxID=2891571 RepID=UPI001F1E8A84|nr:SMP-30/gluconolactonase/LRE family protein [Niabella agricola]MCF3110965.1 SMP-30/gluconolactonase/LRE family protein [Niabella agricola]